MIRETWNSWTTKAVWEWNGRLWVKIGQRTVTGVLMFAGLLYSQDPAQIVRAQEAQAREVRMQHREIAKAQPGDVETPEEKQARQKLEAEKLITDPAKLKLDGKAAK